jgi:tetratricopeptide (TPR) repeat protein
MNRRVVAELEAQLAKDPENLRLLQKLGEALQKMGDEVKAADAFARVAGAYERDGFLLKAVAMLEQCLKLDPSRVDLMGKLVELYRRLQLDTEADAWAGRAARPPGPRPTAPSLEHLRAAATAEPGSQLQLVEGLLQHGLRDEARQVLAHAALLLSPKEPRLAAEARALQLGPTEETLDAELEALRGLRLLLRTVSELPRRPPHGPLN